MKFIVFCTLLFSTLFAEAGFRAYDGNVDRGIYDTLKCSTGLTCTRQGGKLLMTSSPVIDDVAGLTILGEEAGDAVLHLWADEGDDNADKFSFTSAASGNVLQIKNNTSVLGVITSGGASYGLKQNQIASSATTLTVAQCGSTIVSGGAHTMDLPEASTALGCRYTFIVGNASALTVNPDNGDTIMLLANSAGDAISADAIGESVVIEAISASAWAPVGAEKGTWSDVN